jgi:hypothetical protein
MNQQNSIDLTAEPNFPESSLTPPPRYNSNRQNLQTQITSQSREIIRLRKTLDKYERKFKRYKRKYIRTKYQLYLEREQQNDNFSE